MANQKITDYAAITGASVTTSTDLLEIVDFDVLTNKKITIDNLLIALLPSATTNSTFTDNGAGAGTSASVAITTQIVRGFVFFNIPAFTLTTGTGAPATITSNTAFSAAYQPAADVWLACNTVRNNGVAVAGGVVRITTAGNIIVYLDGNLSPYTVSSSCGLNNNFAGVYKL